MGKCFNEFGKKVDSVLGGSLEFTPEGAIGPVGFHRSGRCGRAVNTIGMQWWDFRSNMGGGSVVLTSEQVDALMCFLLEAKLGNPINTPRFDALLEAHP